MTSWQQFIVSFVGAIPVLLTALVGVIRTWKNSGDTKDLMDRIMKLESWQAQQDGKLGAIKDDQKREFENAGKHRYRMDKHLALLESRIRETGRRVESIPTRSEYNFQRGATEPLTPLPTPLPTVAPAQPPLDDPDDMYLGVADEFKPPRKKKK